VSLLIHDSSDFTYKLDFSRDQNESYNVAAHFPEEEVSMREWLDTKRQGMNTEYFSAQGNP
jgi:hypothetical protein